MWQVNVCEYAGNGWFKHFLPCCYPVARDIVEKRIVAVQFVLSNPTSLCVRVMLGTVGKEYRNSKISVLSVLSTEAKIKAVN